jgi:hypothetical protein
MQTVYYISVPSRTRFGVRLVYSLQGKVRFKADVCFVSRLDMF